MIRYGILLILWTPLVYAQSEINRLQQSAETVESFLDELDNWRGVPYRLGGTDQKSGVDDIGLIRTVYRNVFGIALPATADSIWNYAAGVQLTPPEDDLLPCDIVFLQTKNRKTQMVLYIGDDEDDNMICVDPENGVHSGRLQDLEGKITGAIRLIRPTEPLLLRSANYLSEPVIAKVTRKELVKEIQTWLGTPYAWGNNKKQQGADCSGFVTALFQSLFNISLPRSSANMWKEPIGKKIMQQEELLPGDVLFFSYGDRVGHVAVYIGKNARGIAEMAHAKNESEPLGIDPIVRDSYWMKRYIGAKRFVILRDEIAVTEKKKENEKTPTESGSEQWYHSDQPDVSHVHIVKESDRMQIRWFFRDGAKESQTAVLTHDDGFEKKFSSRFPGARFYRYTYIWKGQRHQGTLLEDRHGIIQAEIDENLTAGETVIFSYRPIRGKEQTSSKKSDQKAKPFFQTGEASYYADAFHGRKTANGEIFDMHQLTAAHRTLPFGTRVTVTNLRNGKRVVVRINDRGPFAKGRVIDLSYEAARQLDMIKDGITDVTIETTE